MLVVIDIWMVSLAIVVHLVAVAPEMDFGD